MNKEYNIGDKVWYANCGTHYVEEKCPVCFGKHWVTVILGNDEQVRSPCDFCGKGYEGPQGVIHYYKWEAKPEYVEITGKDVWENPDGRRVRYSHKQGQSLEDNCMFDNEADAIAKADWMQRDHEARETANRKSRKENNYKSYSWHVGYHRKEAAEHRRKAEYHDRRAELCKKAERPNKA